MDSLSPDPDIAKRLACAIGPQASSRLTEACTWAMDLYAGQKHWSGQPLPEHVIDVVTVLREFETDEDTIIACMLHHAMDIRGVMSDDVQERCGTTVRLLVSGINLLSHMAQSSRRMSVENLRLMMLRVSDDPRGILIALCDRLAILGSNAQLGQVERKRLARDVLNLYAPIAARLGIYTIKHRLESLAFPIVYPTDAERIDGQLQAIHERHGSFLDVAATHLERFLLSQGVEARVEGREKQPYSVFMKMREKSLTQIDGLYDLFAMRVIVASSDVCYQALGLLHRISHPVPNRFKDFIAFPKPNGYQSLHTTLLRLPGVPEGVVTEVQIRTLQMHREAEYGVAAHWSYKEGGSAQDVAERAQLQSAIANQQSVVGARGGFMDHIFVLTPKGDVIELPEGATTLDFAFHVHTDLGIAFRGARVNGSIAPMDYRLENGDIVEILRQRDPAPSPRWLTLLKTASARSRLKRYLATQNRPRLLALGRDMLNEELRRRRMELLDGDLTLLRQMEGKTLSADERQDLLMKIGQGTMKASPLLDRLTIQAAVRAKAVVDLSLLEDAKLIVHSDIPMPVKYAKCCSPQMNKKGPIAGTVVGGGSIRVHRADCRFLVQGNPQRRVKVWWGKAELVRVRAKGKIKARSKNHV